jgi:hypothetical protein
MIPEHIKKAFVDKLIEQRQLTQEKAEVEFTKITDPISVLHFIPWTEEYLYWELRKGLYFLFQSELKYIGKAGVVKRNGIYVASKYGLGNRIWEHIDGEELIREFVWEGSGFEVSFYDMSDMPIEDIGNLEQKLIHTEPIPFGNISLRARIEKVLGKSSKQHPIKLDLSKL